MFVKHISFRTLASKQDTCVLEGHFVKLPCEKGNSLFNLEVSHAMFFLETNPSTCLAVHHVYCISSFLVRRKVLDDSEPRLRRLKRRSTDALRSSEAPKIGSQAFSAAQQRHREELQQLVEEAAGIGSFSRKGRFSRRRRKSGKSAWEWGVEAQFVF